MKTTVKARKNLLSALALSTALLAGGAQAADATASTVRDTSHRGFFLGLNAGGGLGGGPTAWALALLGVAATMTGILLPSSILTYSATQWAHRNRELRAVRAFKVGMAPMVIALMLATGWLLIANHDQPQRDWPLWLLATVATLLVWRTKIHLLWLIGAGAPLGALGWV